MGYKAGVTIKKSKEGKYVSSRTDKKKYKVGQSVISLEWQ